MIMSPKAFGFDVVRRVVMGAPPVRRLTWRIGRALYCLARGEQRVDDVRFNGEFDLQAKAVAANRSAARFVAIDVGANQGDWTSALIDRFLIEDGGLGRLDAHVFEPVPSTRTRLEARLKAKGSSATIVGSAASDEPGTLDMIVMSETGGTNSLVYDEAMRKEALGFVSVPVTTLDAYCAAAGIAHIHIVKCDTEGHDASVMRGAAGMLRAGQIDVFQFEYNHRWTANRSFLKDVFSLIDGLPYRIGRVMPDYVELFDEWHPELEHFFQSNYALINASALNWFDARRGTFDNSNTYASHRGRRPEIGGGGENGNRSR